MVFLMSEISLGRYPKTDFSQHIMFYISLTALLFAVLHGLCQYN